MSNDYFENKEQDFLIELFYKNKKVKATKCFKSRYDALVYASRHIDYEYINAIVFRVRSLDKIILLKGKVKDIW